MQDYRNIAPHTITGLAHARVTGLVGAALLRPVVNLLVVLVLVLITAGCGPPS